jgi:ABC-type uncharacterized transport system auxiliary subunit
MKKVISRSSLAVFFLLVLTGCIAPQAAPDVEFYTLEYDPPSIGELKGLPAVIHVERFTTVPTFDSERILFREKQYQMDEYHYHRWRSRPGELVPSFLARDMERSGLFRGVFALDSRVATTHRLEGTVLELFEEDQPESYKAVLAVSVTLIAENEPDISKRIVFQNRYGASEGLRARNPRALAEAMSAAMRKVSESVIRDIHAALSGGKK